MWNLLRPDSFRVLSDRKVRRGYRRYLQIVEDQLIAKFLIAHKIPADYSENDPLEKLWAIHEQLTKEYYGLEKRVDQSEIDLKELFVSERSYFDLKVEIARQMLKSCRLCERKCNVDRLAGKLGYCKCGNQLLVSSMFEHLGEEPEISPSFTIFTLGCNLKCRHCQNWTISQWYEAGTFASSENLVKGVERARKKGCRNANLVGGDPTPWTYHWLEVFRHINVNIPVFWNTNGYYSEECANLLTGFVDIYKIDFKYGNDECAVRISDAPNFFKVCTRNLLMAKEYGDVLIRVLVLPKHSECCTKPILSWIAKNLGPATRVNIMDQYRPEWRAYEIPELRSGLTRQEFEEAFKFADEVGLENVTT